MLLRGLSLKLEPEAGSRHGVGERVKGEINGLVAKKNEIHKLSRPVSHYQPAVRAIQTTNWPDHALSRANCL